MRSIAAAGSKFEEKNAALIFHMLYGRMPMNTRLLQRPRAC